MGRGKIGACVDGMVAKTESTKDSHGASNCFIAVSQENLKKVCAVQLTPIDFFFRWMQLSTSSLSKKVPNVPCNQSYVGQSTDVYQPVRCIKTYGDVCQDIPAPCYGNDMGMLGRPL